MEAELGWQDSCPDRWCSSCRQKLYRWGVCKERIQVLHSSWFQQSEPSNKFAIYGLSDRLGLMYVNEGDFDRVDHVTRSIIKLYRADISKYASVYEQKVTRVFDSVPSRRRWKVPWQTGGLSKKWQTTSAPFMGTAIAEYRQCIGAEVVCHFHLLVYLFI